MKGVVAVLVVVSLIGLGVWLLFMQQSDTESNVLTTEDTPAKLIESANNDELSQSDLAEESQTSSTKTEPTWSNEQQAEKLAEAKAKLDELILEYNENLSDPESRAATQTQINRLLKEYNELVLPVALAKINEN